MTILIAIFAFTLGFVISCIVSAATISDLYDRIRYLEGKTDGNTY